MATPPRTATSGTFFTTAVCHNRRRLFQVPRHAVLFLDTLQHYRTLGLFRLHAFVVMPDHVHLLLTPTGKTISEAMNRVKGGFSHRLASNLPVWQRGFTDHLVRSREDFLAHRAYIHQNPVRAHLSASPELFPYSSAAHPDGERNLA